MSTTTTQHPDWKLIQRVLDDQDHSLPEGWEDRAPANRDEAMEQMQAAFGHLVDPDALHASAVDAVAGVLPTVLPGVLLGLVDPVQALAAVWASAFLAGVRFEQAGGHAIDE